MDIRKWLTENTRTRRNQYALMLGLVLFPLVLMAGLYLLYSNIGKLHESMHEGVAVLSAQELFVDNVHHVQLGYARQMQEWGQLQLDAGSAASRRQHWQNFIAEAKNVDETLSAMNVAALDEHEDTRAATLQTLLVLHQELGRDYRAAYLRLAQSGDPAIPQDTVNSPAAKQFVQQLAELSNDAAHEYESLTSRILASQTGDFTDAQGRVELNLIIITILILVEALLFLRTLNKNNSELNKIVDENEKTVYHLAYTDALTDLPNRRLFQDRLEHAIALSNRTRKFRALMFLDMDNFKALNDSKGHAMGDKLLIEVARRLKASVRVSDTVARLGGDEFVVLLGELSEHEHAASEQALMIANKVSEALSQPYQLGDFIYNCSASIGLTLFCDAAITIEEVHKRADAAMYQAKNAGRNTVRFYDPETQAALEARSELELELRTAVSERQLQVFYQVQVDQNSRPVGAEALIRWLHPEMGMIFPARFVALAEETGLILSIGQWVLESVCAQIKLWERNPLTRELQIAVNVSACQFNRPDFVRLLDGMIKSSGIDPSKLKLELTESMLHENVEEVIDRMRELKALGIKFSMDDFGTGYSSLSYLTQLPLDQLKVDQSFVHNIGIKPADSTIVQTIIGMATNLNLESIAEGVETQAQRDFLERAGCRRYQGYLFGTPVPQEKFTDALREMEQQA